MRPAFALRLMLLEENMSNNQLLSTWVRRFLLEYLISERKFSHNTQKSYRDMLRLLLPFISSTVGKK
nr:site-specific integrase [Escherichia coli]